MMHPDIQVLIEGGLRPHLIAHILKVPRATATAWLAGGNPAPIIADRVHKLAEAVKAAIRDGKLPICWTPSRDSSTSVVMRTHAVVSRYFAECGEEVLGDDSAGKTDPALDPYIDLLKVFG